MAKFMTPIEYLAYIAECLEKQADATFPHGVPAQRRFMKGLVGDIRRFLGAGASS